MAKLGFYFDAESCIACHTCQVACEDVNDLPVGTNYRVVRSFCTGSGWTPRIYNISLPVQGCNLCTELRELGEEPACVVSCPMRALEFGDIDELRTKYGDAVSQIAVLPDPTLTNPSLIMDAKPCAFEEGAIELAI